MLAIGPISIFQVKLCASFEFQMMTRYTPLFNQQQPTITIMTAFCLKDGSSK